MYSWVKCPHDIIPWLYIFTGGSFTFINQDGHLLMEFLISKAADVCRLRWGQKFKNLKSSGHFAAAFKELVGTWRRIQIRALTMTTWPIESHPPHPHPTHLCFVFVWLKMATNEIGSGDEAPKGLKLRTRWTMTWIYSADRSMAWHDHITHITVPTMELWRATFSVGDWPWLHIE